jgi:DNA-binding LytR/AlgR family response regulator
MLNYVLINYYFKKKIKKGKINLFKPFSAKRSYYKSKKYNFNYTNSEYFLINGLNKNESVYTKIDNFIFAKSEGHYIKVYYIVERVHGKHEVVKSLLVRNSMKALLSTVFKDIKGIMRVQNSYIINCTHLKYLKFANFNKTAHIEMDYIKNRIPVSANKINELETYLINNNLLSKIKKLN